MRRQTNTINYSTELPLRASSSTSDGRLFPIRNDHDGSGCRGHFAFRCASGGPSEAEKTDTEGVLLFDLNDSTTVTIPGEWVGDTLLLRNDREELALVPLDARPGLWSIPVFDGTLSLTNDTGHTRRAPTRGIPRGRPLGSVGAPRRSPNGGRTPWPGP